MGISKKKQYQLLYLPVGKFIEINAPINYKTLEGRTVCYGEFGWHIIVKNRTDLRTILNKIINKAYPTEFYTRNEIIITPTNSIHSCHFAFVRSQPTESE